MSGAVRIGGQALADGVLMRTDRAWAVAREDGSVQVGELPASRVRRIPVVRVLVAVASGLRLAVGRRHPGRGRSEASAAVARRRNLRFLTALVAVEGLGLALTLSADAVALPRWASVGAVLVPWLVAFTVLRLAAPPSLWRYHGAEHKAVAAHEASVDLDDVEAVLARPRVHDRCGTNLVFLAVLGSLALAGAPAALQAPALLVLLGGSAEVVSAAARRPRSPLSRLVLAGGRALQRRVTTAEPGPAEQAVACRALVACLAHHRGVTAAVATPMAEPAAA